MFHVMLVLFPIILLVIMGSILLFGIVSVLAGLFGGTAAALFIKNKSVKNILIIGFSIVLLFGALCVLPFIVAFSSIALVLLPSLGVLILVLIGALAIGGIKISTSIHNKIGRILLTILFGIICVIAATALIILLYLALG